LQLPFLSIRPRSSEVRPSSGFESSAHQVGLGEVDPFIAAAAQYSANYVEAEAKGLFRTDLLFLSVSPRRLPAGNDRRTRQKISSIACALTLFPTHFYKLPGAEPVNIFIDRIHRSEVAMDPTRWYSAATR
jgi:hypothetical protein